ncbi:N-acetylglutaminylglutamine synthetase [Sphingosinicella sp. BN140058]|uniref:N-acetylglutaminylglutamine synthetase n=1 Tax=Sphingosinicella sp. BN140058 TaxID=1892855 RepID=UPI001012A982|nr:N-acetylglutaminylglutamine synthetase [Sphingosinicella sp. BN140058]QAY75740.1 N-acetylglutaminylglutamine synthetase [Sphingosinicella sp. BN140058]
MASRSDDRARPGLFPFLKNPHGPQPRANALADCGWGRILFAQTFGDADHLLSEIRTEGQEQRDIAMYVSDPHVLLAAAPAELFLDPSHTFRLKLATYRAADRRPSGFVVRRLVPDTDIDGVNRLYALHRMIEVRPDFFEQQANGRLLTYFVAEDEETGAIIGTVTGIDHVCAFDDPEKGASLWTLAVDPQTPHPGVGEALIRWLAEHYIARGAATMDLSVLHDNKGAIALYEKLGFHRLPVFAVKRRNVINERLFAGNDPAKAMNPYARIIINEARRRGIGVEVIDADGGLFELRSGGRTIRCRESLSDLTTAVALSICDDKAMTRRIVEAAGVSVPDEIEADDQEAVRAMLERYGSLVVKPARGEQGRGVAVDLDTIESVEQAIGIARQHSDRVLVESFHKGDDLRLVVIGFKLVAAAIRRPAEVIGNGRDTVRQLIERQSRRRAAATGGESNIPLDAETERCVAKAGYRLDDVPAEGVAFAVRKAANLHTGGTIHDVTELVHPRLVEAAIKVARAIDIPVVGVDFIVPNPTEPDYVFIEANERPGLANHEPQPTAERFIDLLFPLSMPAAARDVRRADAAAQH